MSARILGIAILLTTAGAVAASPPTRTEFDQKIAKELAAQDPHAAELFEQANQARERDDAAAASALYAKVEALAPSFSHAYRRHATTELQLRHFEAAVTLARKAVELDSSAFSEATLAMALLADPAARAANRAEAIELAGRAHRQMPQDRDVLVQLCQLALVAQDVEMFKQMSASLSQVDPEGPFSLFFQSLSEAMRGDFGDALATLDRAHHNGLPDALYDPTREKFRSAQPWYERILPPMLWLSGAWIGGMVALLLVGLLLSAATLRASRRVPTEPHGHARGFDRFLRRLYAAVLWLCCAYYYISIPFTVAIVVLVGGGLIYACFALGHVPIKLVLIIAVVVLVTVSAVLKSLFVRVKSQEPGRKLQLDEHPQLRAVLAEVAARVGTRPVDAVYLTPGVDLAVTEHGGVLGRMRGTNERRLILGAAVLDGFPLGAFRAVLAHEYGHFVNRDTAGGGFALLVRRSLYAMAFALARGGAATWYNPAWWFVRGFHRVFLGVSQGASRLQEVLADRWAAVAYGSAPFEAGLRHVIAADVRFDAHVDATLKEVSDAHRPLVNLYRHPVAQAPDAANLQQKVEESLNRAASPYDSHPRPIDRITWVRAIGAEHPPAADDGNDAWSLFGDRERYEREMTTKILDVVRAQFGVDIPNVEEEPPPPAAA
jgi:Zn-dependent protease with chaperone function